ncbi:TOM1-like protein 5 isoform X1 [Vitis riparia]|uniref:TOM1-like protein 5 isoform X1 n=2 Tax=Vitis riparia TaxID=96939 RepID=UPI00155AAF8B|nr:TOM1-like protein 5 isoform X1 [Vitis riparia]XP_034690833.1 TOM1-like protein 5 isoform X1 [Vitis riparia]XP_034690834.1 TOM1-like protein 5 isoform X1 [Vitis riparia]
MAGELVNSATSEKLTEMDWTKNIEICELVGRDQRQAKDVTKAIKKRLGSKNSNTQLLAVMLLEMLMNNIGEPVHRQVIDNGLLPILVKIVKKKTDLPVREKIFLLLDATQTSLGGASAKFPQYYSAYYDLVSAGVQFPQRPCAISSDPPTSQENRNSSPGVELVSSKHEEVVQQASQVVPESSIIQKAGAALEVLRDVLDAVDTQHPEGAKDEFTLDLVEQCSFQKQRVMHLVMTSRDEKVVSQAIELNEQLHQILVRHDALLSGTPTSTANHVYHEGEEEEEAEQLFRRLRKGKACALPEDEERPVDRPPFGLLGTIPGEMLNRPLIRPVSLEPSHESRPLPSPLASAIPPPPSKHVEREKYFQENKGDGSAVAGHMRSLSLHSRNASSSHSGSIDSSD